MALFKLGQTVKTRGVDAQIDHNEILTALSRHVAGDWGDVCKEDAAMNDDAVKNGNRILSSYEAKDGTKFWIITEWDRSVTTVLLPEEY